MNSSKEGLDPAGKFNSRLASSTTYRFVSNIALCVLTLLATAVTVWTIKRALGTGAGKDFQWSPTRLFVAGEDPYQAALSGSHEIILTQAPNYLHILYLIYSPFGFVSFQMARAIWVGFNLLLAVGIILSFARVMSWKRSSTLFIGCIFVVSTPVRFALINGQTSLLLLAAASFAFAYRDRAISGIALAVVMAKYSFFPIALYFFFARRWKTILVAFGVSALALISFAIVVGRANLLKLLVEPLEVSRRAVARGIGDVMSVLEATVDGNRSDLWMYCVGLVLAVVLGALIVPRLVGDHWMWALAIYSIISLICFKHLVHDFVFLLPVLAVARFCNRARKVIIILVVSLQWFGFGVLDQVGVSTVTATMTVISFASMCALLWAVVPGRPLTDSRTRL